MISCQPFPTILNIKPIPDDQEQKLQAITGWIELSGKLSETPPAVANSPRDFWMFNCSGPLWWMTSSANWRPCRSSAVGVLIVLMRDWWKVASENGETSMENGIQAALI